MTDTRKIAILDTDIGGDIDDTWALAMLLKSPELDTRLIVTATADTCYRARIVAKFLERHHRLDIPIGIGPGFASDGPRERQKGWVEDYALENYPGEIRPDGIRAMIEVIETATAPVWLIGIAPLTNIVELLRQAPHLAPKVNLAVMAGSITKNHEDRPGAIAEFNVVKDIAAAAAVFAAPWRSMTLTPLDTCGSVVLRHELYQKLLTSSDPMVQDIITNYRIWQHACNASWNPSDSSSILYDTVAIHLAYSTRFLTMKTMKLMVDAEGFTREAPGGRPIQVALDWQDQNGYLTFLTERLLS